MVFFGYPSKPETQREVMSNAADRIRARPEVKVRTWEELRIGGKVIITEIANAIRASDLAAFDVTVLNENVMFEVGFAIGASRRIWLVRDASDEHSNRRWKQLGILGTIGYRPYENSADVYREFWRDRPFEYATTMFEDAIQPGLRPSGTPSVFFIQSAHNTEANRALTRVVREVGQRGYHPRIVDPTESSVQPLPWYGQQVFDAAAVVVHLSAARRTNADIHNARCALIAGLAAGMNHPVLMLAEEDYSPPVDYRDLLYVYRDSRMCTQHADTWLRNQTPTVTLFGETPLPRTPLRLATDLQHLRLGEIVAEHEDDTLQYYFVPTAGFSEVLAERDTVFVGRKGAGKTANLLEAARVLGSDARNLVTLIQPLGYEVDGVLRLLKTYQQRDNKGYVTESLWKFLVYSEIARAAKADLERRVRATPGSAEWEFMQFMEGEEALAGDFAARLETAVARLSAVGEPSSVSSTRAGVAEALHESALQKLRLHLGKVLTRKERVAVLVDNLDKAWARGAEFDHLALFFRGLLNSMQRISADFARRDYWREPVPVTLAVFMRSDIYAEVARQVREPDKIPVSRLSWSSPEMLLRVIEERYAATTPEGTVPSDFWRHFADVEGAPASAYILSRILPRPRDIVYICKAAITAAINKKHARVEGSDLAEAERSYSQFAFDAMLVEGVTEERLESVLYEFVGADAILSEPEVVRRIERAGVAGQDSRQILETLRSFTFIGVEYRDGAFDFSEDARERQPLDILAEQRAARLGGTRTYQIHRAFRTFLEVQEARR